MVAESTETEAEKGGQEPEQVWVVWVSLKGTPGLNMETSEPASVLTQFQLQRGPSCRMVLQVALADPVLPYFLITVLKKKKQKTVECARRTQNPERRGGVRTATLFLRPKTPVQSSILYCSLKEN